MIGEAKLILEGLHIKWDLIAKHESFPEAVITVGNTQLLRIHEADLYIV